MLTDILIVDDEIDICELVGGILSDEGYKTRFALGSVEALESIKERQPNLIILDVWLGDGSRDGLKILEIIKRDHPYVPVIMMSGHGTVETAVTAIKLGAYDFIEKPFQTEKLLITISRAIESSKLKRENNELKIKSPFLCSLIGSSSQIQNVKQSIDSCAATNTRIFIHGPIGCDRSAIARYIHDHSNRVDNPFFSINCSAATQQQIDSDLFGLETISSDNSVPRKIGLLEHAHGGTLFIDEISFLSQTSQSKLINFLHANSFSRIGGHSLVDVNVRIICGSSFSKDEILKHGSFKSDLYYRTSVVSVEIPNLSDRSQDIPLLAKHFLSAIAASQNVVVKNFSTEALSVLESYPWPGDIQQFKNVIEWIVIMNSDINSKVIEIDDLPAEIIQGNEFSKSWGAKTAQIASMPIKDAREIFEKEYLHTQLKRFNGHISQTAKFIGMDRASLHRKLRSLGLTSEEE